VTIVAGESELQATQGLDTAAQGERASADSAKVRITKFDELRPDITKMG